MSTGSNRSEPFSDKGAAAAATARLTPTNSSGNSTRAATVHQHHHHHHHHQKKQLGEVILELSHISKSFPIEDNTDVVHALRDICVSDGLAKHGRGFPSVRQGEFVMLRGPSGGGKTTLLNIIGTIDLPTTGTLNLLGSNIDKDSGDDFLSMLRLKHIGFVFQTFNLLSTMSALENVELPMTLLGELSEKERKSRAKKLLSLVGLRNRMHHLPSELSGGEQQRVTIARSLANNPGLLLLDEPTGDLDTATTIQVMDLLCQINYMSGVTMIMVTHNPDVECYADRILYLGDGRFHRQVVNAVPVPLVREEYEDYLKKIDNIPVMSGAGASPLMGLKKQPATAGNDSSSASYRGLGGDDDDDETSADSPGDRRGLPSAVYGDESSGADGDGGGGRRAKSNPLQSPAPGLPQSETATGATGRLDSDQFDADNLFRRPAAAAESGGGGLAAVAPQEDDGTDLQSSGDVTKSSPAAAAAPRGEVPAWRRAAEARTSQVSSGGGGKKNSSNNNGKKANDDDDFDLPPVQSGNRQPAARRPVLANGEEVPHPDPYQDRNHKSPKNSSGGSGADDEKKKGPFSHDDL